MSDRTCAGCHDNPVRDNVMICRRCENQTRYALADQAAHYGDLLVALTRMVRMNAATDGGRAASRALGWAQMGDRYLESINEAQMRELVSTLPPARPAADAMHSQRSLLVSWSRLLIEEDMATEYPADSIPAMACFIEAHLPDLRMHECAGELVAEVKALTRQIVKAIDTPENTTKVLVGGCTHTWTEENDGEVRCQGEMFAIFPRDPDARPVIRCNDCRNEWNAEHWRKIGDEVAARSKTEVLLASIFGRTRGNWHTVQEAAKMLGVTERSIRHGVEQGSVRHLVVGGGKKRKWYLVDWDDAAKWATKAG